MGKAQARVTAAATLAAVYAAWHLTGGMHGAVFHLHTPPAVTAVTTAATATSQCQALPTPSASPTAAATSSASTAEAEPQLCISIQAAQASIERGKTATWTIQVSAQDGPATSVAVTLTTAPGGLAAAFAGSCPSGGGTATCVLGDMGTSLTPTSYELQAQVPVPANVAAATLTLTAAADTSPAITDIPAAGQTITITAPAPARTRTASTPTTTAPVIQRVTPRATLPAAPITTMPAIGAMPTTIAVATTVPPGSISTVLPQITPAVATAPAAVPGTAVMSSPAANIQAVATASSTPGADAFSVNIGMSAQTAQILGGILLALVITLAATRLTSSYITRTRHPRSKNPALASTETGTTSRSKRRLKVLRLRLRLPALQRPRLRPSHSRADRRTTREQNWNHYLQAQQEPPPSLPAEPEPGA